MFRLLFIEFYLFRGIIVSFEIENFHWKVFYVIQITLLKKTYFWTDSEFYALVVINNKQHQLHEAGGKMLFKCDSDIWINLKCNAFPPILLILYWTLKWN